MSDLIHKNKGHKKVQYIFSSRLQRAFNYWWSDIWLYILRFCL